MLAAFRIRKLPDLCVFKVHCGNEFWDSHSNEVTLKLVFVPRYHCSGARPSAVWLTRNVERSTSFLISSYNFQHFSCRINI